MTNETFAALKRLSGTELIDTVQALAARERGATALLVAHLAELDTRDVLLRERLRRHRLLLRRRHR